jgi:hypothetical protein
MAGSGGAPPALRVATQTHSGLPAAGQGALARAANGEGDDDASLPSGRGRAGARLYELGEELVDRAPRNPIRSPDFDAAKLAVINQVVDRAFLVAGQLGELPDAVQLFKLFAAGEKGHAKNPFTLDVEAVLAAKNLFRRGRT